MRKVRFVEPAKVYRMIKDELDAAYFDVMSKGELIDRGHLRSFEGNLAKYVGTKYAVGLNSGYDALHLSLRAAGIRAGDEVLVPAHTFVATCSAVVNVGATPVLVDVGKDFNIDAEKIEEAISPRTRGIIPVHLNGYMADMPQILDRREEEAGRRRGCVPEPGFEHPREGRGVLRIDRVLEFLSLQDSRRIRGWRGDHDG